MEGKNDINAHMNTATFHDAVSGSDEENLYSIETEIIRLQITYNSRH